MAVHRAQGVGAGLAFDFGEAFGGGAEKGLGLGGAAAGLEKFGQIDGGAKGVGVGGADLGARR